MTTHDDLVARYGKPEHLPDRVPGEVFVFAHETEESARAYSNANAAMGHIAAAITLDGEHWVTVVDIRPALAKIEAAFAEAAIVHLEGPS